MYVAIIPFAPVTRQHFPSNNFQEIGKEVISRKSFCTILFLKLNILQTKYLLILMNIHHRLENKVIRWRGDFYILHRSHNCM